MATPPRSPSPRSPAPAGPGTPTHKFRSNTGENRCHVLSPCSPGSQPGCARLRAWRRFHQCCKQRCQQWIASFRNLCVGVPGPHSNAQRPGIDGTGTPVDLPAPMPRGEPGPRRTGGPAVAGWPAWRTKSRRGSRGCGAGAPARIVDCAVARRCGPAAPAGSVVPAGITAGRPVARARTRCGGLGEGGGQGEGDRQTHRQPSMCPGTASAVPPRPRRRSNDAHGSPACGAYPSVDRPWRVGICGCRPTLPCESATGARLSTDTSRANVASSMPGSRSASGSLSATRIVMPSSQNSQRVTARSPRARRSRT